VVQARVYARVIRECLKEGCRDVTFWGFTDAHSHLGPAEEATLFDADYRSKPAVAAVRRVLTSLRKR